LSLALSDSRIDSRHQVKSVLDRGEHLGTRSRRKVGPYVYSKNVMNKRINYFIRMT
jgi:hypothetical protein